MQPAPPSTPTRPSENTSPAIPLPRSPGYHLVSSYYLLSKRGLPKNEPQESGLLQSIRSALRATTSSGHINYEGSQERYGSAEAEELSWDSNTVLLTCGGIIQKQWSFDHEGQTVQWACIGWLEQFDTVTSRGPGKSSPDSPDEPGKGKSGRDSTFGPFARAAQDRKTNVQSPSRMRAVFVFLRSIGKIYLENGVEHSFSLPFIVRSAWPLHPHGVLLHRVQDFTELQEAQLSGDETLPTLFSLTSPLSEATIVALADPVSADPSPSPTSPTDERKDVDQPVSPKEIVVWVSRRDTNQDYDLIVTMNPESRRLSIWRYEYVRPRDFPSSARAFDRRKRRSTAANLPKPGQPTSSANDSFAWHARPSADMHPLEPPAPELPPLSALPGMPPSLSTTTTMASLVGGSSQASSSLPAKVRRNSLGRNDLSSTMDRMALGGRGDAELSLGLTDPTKMRAAYWMSQLHSLEVTDADGKVNVVLFDERFDGHEDRAMLAICLGESHRLLLYAISRSEDKPVKATLRAERSAVACVALRATRDNVYDLLAVRPDGTLAIYTHGIKEVTIAHPDQFPRSSLPPDIPVIPAKLESRNFHDWVGAVRKVVGAKLAVKSTVDLIFEGGGTSRVVVDFVPKDILTTQCLQVLALVLSAETYFKLHVAFLQQWARRQLDYSDSVEFECFCSAVYQTFALETGGDAMETDSPAGITSRIENKAGPTARPGSPRAALSRIAVVIRPEWADYWARFCPDAMAGWRAVDIGPLHVDDHLPVWPPDMSAILYGRISNPDWNLPWYDTHRLASQFKHEPSFAYGRLDPLGYLRQLTAIYKALADKAAEDIRKRSENAMMLMVKSRIGLDFLRYLPLGVAAPLREVIRTCQLSPGQDWPAVAYHFIGRNDLAEAAQAWSVTSSNGYRTGKDFLGNKLPKSFGLITKQAAVAASGEVSAVTGVDLGLEDFTHIRFGQDKRLDEVARLLCSSTVSSVRMVDRPELNEHDQIKEQQNQVLRIAERTLALPLGRAMFTFGSVHAVTRESYSIPKMEFAIRLQPQNITITPDPNKIPPESLNWGDFHNGVAAALRISPGSEMIDSSWIKFNKPSELTPEHAGFLFGLGLTGHLKEMRTWHTFGYLTPKHELTSIGVLLGLSAANVGSGDRHVTKLLAVHTPALLPTPSIDLNVPLITQAAGLVGIGLLFMGTKHRRMAEVCLKQISRGDLNQPDITNEHREAYTLAAALAFGMVMLGKGSSPVIPADEAMISELRVLIHGEAPSHLRMGRARPTFDINLTSPAATIALGLMYLKTNCHEIADILVVPDTILALNRIPPSFLLMRTLAKALIMWDAIQPTQEWLNSQIPAPIVKAMDARFTGQHVDDAFELAYHNLIAGCCFAIALKFAGTAREEPYVLLISYYDLFSRLAYTNGPAFDHRIKRHAIRDGLNLISIALNMVMAGTGEINCLRRLRYSYGMYNQAMRYGTHMSTHMSLGLLFLGGGRFTLGNSDAAVACMIASFFPRFAPVSSDNKSYLQALRHLWALAVEPRCLVARDVDTKDIVYLPVKIKVKEEKETGVAQLISPTLIPDFDKLLSIRVDTPRYWPFYLDLWNVRRHKDALLRDQTIFVKRRTAFLSYLEDPKGSRSLFVRSGSSTGDAATLDFPQLTDTKAHPASDLNQFISSFSNDPTFLSFANHLCREDGETAEERLFYAYCHATLLDSILQDKPQTLQSHVILYRYRTMSPSSQYFNLRLQDLRFASDFYGKVYDRRFSGRVEKNSRSPLIRDSTLSGTLYALDQQLERVRASPQFTCVLRQYAKDDALAALSSSDMTQKLAWSCSERTRALLECAAPEGTTDEKALEKGIQEVLHATGSQMTTTLGSGWSVRSLEEIMLSWKAL
ncbi:hypothetical protein EWM64_g6232 [Hericium alpestre]|uniref:Uncharacterized protein n=1 Tax=Hericium alpestre TaxID=135208 RepID=A0A4Y9ZUC6_9AGAM|nr:hypothetical protein EWM64_g6232 [Hericium alpestre]